MFGQALLLIQQCWSNAWINWTLRLGVTISLLVLVISRVNIGSIITTLQQVNPGTLALLTLTRIGILYLQSLQTTLGIKPLGLRVNLGTTFRAYLGSMFYTLVLPASAVGGIIWYKIGKPGDKLIEAGLLLFFFRLLQTLLLLGIGLAGIWLDPGLRQSPLGLVVSVLLGLGLVLTLPFVSNRTTQSMQRLAKPLLRLPLLALLRNQMQRVWQAIQLFQQLPRFTPLWVSGLSLLIHTIGIWRIGLAAQAVGIQQPILVLAWTYILMYIISLIPISIAGLGVREVSFVLLLSRYGVPEGQALGMSLLLFSVIVVIGLVGGLIEVWEFWRHSRPPLIESHNTSHSPSDNIAEG